MEETDRKKKYHNSDNADVAEAHDTQKQICKVHSMRTVKKLKQNISERSVSMKVYVLCFQSAIKFKFLKKKNQTRMKRRIAKGKTDREFKHL